MGPALLRAAAGVTSPSQAPLIGAVARRLLCSSRVVAMAHGSHTSDNNPDILEKEKQRNLTGQTPEIIPGEPGFNPALASESEAVVRAERARSMPLEELQAHSINIIQHLHEGAEHPGVPDEVVNPSSDSPAIQENLKRSSQKQDVHDLL